MKLLCAKSFSLPWIQVDNSPLHVVPGGSIASEIDAQMRASFQEAIQRAPSTYAPGSIYGQQATDVMLGLRKALLGCRDVFDFFIIDTPAYGILREGAFLSADALLAPVGTQPADVFGLGALERTLEEQAELFNVAHAPVLVVPVKYQARLKSDKEALKLLKKRFSKDAGVLRHYQIVSEVPMATAAARAFGSGSVFDSEPKSAVAYAFERVAGEIASRLLKTEPRHER